MKWREVIIGSVATLVVTVVAGVAIFYLTREESQPRQPPAEQLVFNVQTPVAFDSDQTKLSFTNITVRNTGDAPANNVVLGVEVPEEVRIIDQSITLSSGPSGTFAYEKQDSTHLDVRIPILTPQESATVAILTDAADETPPTVAVKSDAAMGIEERHVLWTEPENRRISEVFSWLVPFALVAQFALLMFLRQRRFLRRIVPVFPSLNNTAFVLLHRGLVDMASNILEQSIAAKGGEPHSLANYGLAVGLQGDSEKSEKLLDAAEFWAETHRHSQAVVAFNRALLCFNSGKESDGVSLIRKAFRLSKSEIVRYSQFSSIVAKARENNAEFHSVLNEFGVLKGP